MILMLLIRTSVRSVPPMKQMQERAKQQQNIRQGTKQMCSVLFPKEKGRDGEKPE